MLFRSSLIFPALFDYITERAGKISEQGIMVEGVSGEYTVNVPVVTEAIPFQPDFVLICVKSNETSEAGQSIKPLLGPKTVVVTLQNVVGNVEMLEGLFGTERVLGGVTAEGATLLEWGKIIHAGQGDTIMGPKGDPDSPAEKVISAFNKAGFKTT